MHENDWDKRSKLPDPRSPMPGKTHIGPPFVLTYSPQNVEFGSQLDESMPSLQNAIFRKDPTSLSVHDTDA